jgi:hypothetical protein
MKAAILSTLLICSFAHEIDAHGRNDEIIDILIATAAQRTANE